MARVLRRVRVSSPPLADGVFPAR